MSKDPTSKNKQKTVFVTGGCGFIGTNFIHYLLSLPNPPRIINLDCLTYAGNLSNISPLLKDSDLEFIKGDICDKNLVSSIFSDYEIDVIFNFAAESHVDRSISNPQKFFETNVGGTLNLLQLALEKKIDKFIQISTDEVYGSLSSEGFFVEDTPLSPRSPYSASKASADTFVQAFFHTYGLNTIITRCSNNYGPYQFPEKLIPLMINNILLGRKLPIYGDGSNVRDWIYVEDHCRGIWAAYEKGKSGEVYNFGGEKELSNLQLVKILLQHFNSSEENIEFVVDRLGHDFRYAMNIEKAKRELDWYPLHTFEIGLEKTTEWYIQNKSWLDLINSGDYKKI